jgi:hypothetical protein
LADTVGSGSGHLVRRAGLCDKRLWKRASVINLHALDGPKPDSNSDFFNLAFSDSVDVPHADPLALPLDYTHSDAGTHAHALAYPHSVADTHAIAYANPDGGPHTHAFAYPHSVADTHTHAIAYPNADTVSDPFANALSDSLAYTDFNAAWPNSIDRPGGRPHVDIHIDKFPGTL